MSRWWTEHVADFFAAVSDFFHSLVHLLGLVPWTYVLLAVLAVAAVWVIYKLVRALMGRPRRSKKSKKDKETAVDEPTTSDDEDHGPADIVPDRPAVVYASLADKYAAEGRWAEAVRERFRAMVRRMIEAGIIASKPGATVTELAAEATAARPALGPAVFEASQIFSDIWYGERPATAAHDQRMRELGPIVDDATALVGAAR